MNNLKAKWASFFFKLKPGIKKSVDKHKYQKTINSFEEPYSDIGERIAELLPEHIELRRENAMCKGDGWCDFLYYRK